MNVFAIYTYDAAGEIQHLIDTIELLSYRIRVYEKQLAVYGIKASQTMRLQKEDAERQRKAYIARLRRIQKRLAAQTENP